MKKALALVVLVTLLALSGCVPSLHPLYTEKDLIAEPALLGSWVDLKSKESWTFKQDGEKQYKVVYTDNENKIGEFSVHVLRMGGQEFLDLYPVEPKLQENGFYSGHLLRVHTFLHASQTKPTLKMSFLDPDWLKKFLEKNPSAIRHEKVDEDEIVLTASPRELQKFLLAHLKTPGAFSQPTELQHQ